MRTDHPSPQKFEDPARFEALVREHQAMVFRTLMRMTGSGAHVEDLAQEVFLRLYRALPEFRGDSALSTYLYRIVVNVAQDEWKRRRREREVVAARPLALDEDSSEEWLENLPADMFHAHGRTPEQILSDGEVQDAVDSALLSLSEPERAVLVLYHQEELSYDAIAAALSMPINTVRTHLHRGRKRMSELVRGQISARSRREPASRYPVPVEARP